MIMAASMSREKRLAFPTVTFRCSSSHQFARRATRPAKRSDAELTKKSADRPSIKAATIDRSEDQRSSISGILCAIPERDAGNCGAYVDEPLAIIAGTRGPTNTKYLHNNRVNSVAALTNSSRTIVERYRYDARNLLLSEIHSPGLRR
jgi:hypothetical protein